MSACHREGQSKGVVGWAAAVGRGGEQQGQVDNSGGEGSGGGCRETGGAAQ